MSVATAKLQLLIDLKNNLKSGLDAAKKQVEKTTGQMQSKLDAFKASNMKLFDAIEDRVPGVGRAIKILANPYMAVAAVAMSAATAIGLTTAKAVDWQTEMAQINVTAGVTQEKLKGISDELLNIGRRNVASLEEVPKAFNRILSAGLDVNQSIEILEPTLRAAKAGFTDIETVASAAVSTLMSSGENVNKVYDVLFATLNVGNAEFRDIAQYLPKTIPLARNIGFAMDETAGAYATLTGKLSAEQSTTALQGIMRSFSNNNIVEKFKEIGVNIFDASGKARPLLDIITDLNKQMSGLIDKQRMIKFDSLGLDQMSTLGFSTLIQDMSSLQSNMQEVINSQGALNKAYADSITPLDDFKIVMNMIKAKAIEIGQTFLPVLTAIGKIALFVANNFSVFLGVIGGLGATWGVLNAKLVASAAIQGVLAVKTALVTAAQWAFNVAASANPIGLIIMLIGALIGGLIVAYKKFDSFRAIVQGSWEVLKGFGNILKNFVIDRIKGVISGIGNMGKAISLFFKGDFDGAYSTAKQGVIDLSGFNSVKNAVDSSKGLKTAFTNKYTESLTESKRNKATSNSNSPTSDFAGVPVFGNSDTESFTNNNTTTSDAKKITAGSQSKVNNIRIDSIIKNFSPTHQSIIAMSKDELERWLTNIITRVINNMDLA